MTEEDALIKSAFMYTVNHKTASPKDVVYYFVICELLPLRLLTGMSLKYKKLRQMLRKQ